MQCTRKNKYLRKMFQNNALNSLKKPRNSDVRFVHKIASLKIKTDFD